MQVRVRVVLVVCVPLGFETLPLSELKGGRVRVSEVWVVVARVPPGRGRRDAAPLHPLSESFCWYLGYKGTQRDTAMRRSQSIHSLKSSELQPLRIPFPLSLTPSSRICPPNLPPCLSTGVQDGRLRYGNPLPSFHPPSSFVPDPPFCTLILPPSVLTDLVGVR